jgi:hypothetical protein
MAMNDTVSTGPILGYAARQEPADPGSSGVAWPAIIAGAFASTAAALVLLTLASGFGLASVSPGLGHGASAETLTVATAIGLVALNWVTSGLGGYLTGRLRTKWVGLHTHEVFFRDTANGFIMWALSTVVIAVVVASVAAFTVSGAAGVASTAVQGSAAAAGPDAYMLDTLFRADHVTATDAETKAQSGRIMLNAIRAGTMPDADHAYLAQSIASNTGISPADAGKRIDTAMADVNTAKQKALQAVDSARKATATGSIYTGIAMLIAAFIASVAAAIGGQQRDEY